MRRVIRGGSRGSGAVEGSGGSLSFTLKCGDTWTGSSSIGVKFEDKMTLIGRR